MCHTQMGWQLSPPSRDETYVVIEGWLAPLTEARFVRMGDLSCDDFMMDKITSLSEFDEQSGRCIDTDICTDRTQGPIGRRAAWA